MRHHAERCGGVGTTQQPQQSVVAAAKVREESVHPQQQVVEQTQTIYIPVDQSGGGQHQVEAPGGQHITVTAEDGTVVSTHQIIAVDGGEHPHPHHVDTHQVVQIHQASGGPHHILLQQHQQPVGQHQQLQHHQIQLQQLQPMEVQAVQTRGPPTVQTLHFRQQ